MKKPLYKIVIFWALVQLWHLVCHIESIAQEQSDQKHTEE